MPASTCKPNIQQQSLHTRLWACAVSVCLSVCLQTSTSLYSSLMTHAGKTHKKRDPTSPPPLNACVFVSMGV